MRFLPLASTLRPRVEAVVSLGLPLNLAGFEQAPNYAPKGLPAPGPITDQPRAPRPISPDGVVGPLEEPDSPRRNHKEIREAEKYNRGCSPGCIKGIGNIHNPSIELHSVDVRGKSAIAVNLLASGEHRTLNVRTQGNAAPGDPMAGVSSRSHFVDLHCPADAAPASAATGAPK